MSIGFACLTLGLYDYQFRTVMAKNANKETLYEVINHNLTILDKMIDYCAQNKIYMYRISSDLIPFGSSPINQLPWESLFQEKFISIGKKIIENRIRVSLHPGQYTVLNSFKEDVVDRAILDLIYHNKILDLLKVDSTHKIILHIGGAYQNKQAAIQNFENNYKRLNPDIQSRLVIENDDKIYTIEEVLQIGEKCQIPVVYDNLHNQINPSFPLQSDKEWIERCARTWKPKDGKQKTHYSQQAKGKKSGSHSFTIDIETFLQYYRSTNSHHQFDIMLEVKDKNLSAIKCNQAVFDYFSITDLEKEWAKYKYLVLERSPNIYQAIRLLLQSKKEYPVVAFYSLLEEAFAVRLQTSVVCNSLEHVWGYFKDKATLTEKKKFFSMLEKYKTGIIKLQQIKRYLFRLATSYQITYLLQSYYFEEDFIN